MYNNFKKNTKTSLGEMKRKIFAFLLKTRKDYPIYKKTTNLNKTKILSFKIGRPS